MMSHPYEGPRSEGREGGFDALVELGSVPVHLLHGINDLFDHLNRLIRESAPRSNKRAIVMSILAVGALLLSACGFWEGKSLIPPVHVSPIQQQVDLNNAIYQSRQQATVEAQQQERQAQLVANQETHSTSTEQPNPYENWTEQYAVVQPDEPGVLAVLERAYGVAPYKMTDLPPGYIQVFIIVPSIHNPIQENSAYDWDRLLELNPTVYEGDQILHDVFTLSSFSDYKQQQDISEENTHVVR